MITRRLARSAYQIANTYKSSSSQLCSRCSSHLRMQSRAPSKLRITSPSKSAQFHTTAYRSAQSPTADELMENLNDLYGTARDEFEIAAEETEKKTVYAQDDRDAAREALTLLKEALEKAVRESDPEVAKEVTSRVGQRVRELENAVIAMEESAMED